MAGLDVLATWAHKQANSCEESSSTGNKTFLEGWDQHQRPLPGLGPMTAPYNRSKPQEPMPNQIDEPPQCTSLSNGPGSSFG